MKTLATIEDFYMQLSRGSLLMQFRVTTAYEKCSTSLYVMYNVKTEVFVRVFINSSWSTRIDQVNSSWLSRDEVKFELSPVQRFWKPVLTHLA